METMTPPPISRPPTLPNPPAQPEPEQHVGVWPIIRDVLIVWVLTAIGGVVAGIATGGAHRHSHRFMLAVMTSNVLLGTVAFTIAGCLAPPGRWRHLSFVAAGAWLTSLINVIFFHVTILQWMSSALFIAAIMSLGGGLSYLFKRDIKPSA